MKCNNLIWIVYIKSELKTAEGDNFFAEYRYGADGFRSGKKVNGVSTGYVYDGMYIVGESVDGVNYTYSRGTGLLGYTSSLGETVYYRTNVHGDVKELVNVFGESLERYDYNAYGAEDEDYNPFRRMFGKKSVHNPFRYTGEYTDSETGLVYLRNRMYDPETGRFISEDTHWNIDNCIYGDHATNTPDITAIAQSSNLYVYCINNPVRYIDNSGDLGIEINTFTIPWVRQQLIWKQGVRALNVAKLTVSAQMLDHSIRWFSAENVNITETGISGSDRIDGMEVINLLKASPTINNEIDWQISYANNDGVNSFYWSDVLTLNDTTDMYLSFNNATVTLIGNKNESGEWTVNVKVHDIYDFSVEKFSNITSFRSAIGSAAGTVAAMEQMPIVGAIKTYTIDVDFKIQR